MANYNLEINGKKSKLNRNNFSYEYSYKNSKVKLKISKNHAIISFTKNNTINYDKIFSDNKIKNAIEKVTLIHLLKFSEPLSITDYSLIDIENGNIIIDKNECNENIFFSLIDGKLNKKLHQNFCSEDIIQKVLDYNKSQNDQKLDILKLYLISQNKKNILDRFIYLWIVVNAMYGNLKTKNKEIKKINEFQRSLNLTNIEFKNLNKKDFFEIKQKFINFNKEIKTKNDLINNIDENLKNDIIEILNLENINNFDNDELNNIFYTFVVLIFCYNKRCFIMHGSEKYNTIYIGNKNEIKIIEMLVNLLEEFIIDYFPLI